MAEYTDIIKELRNYHRDLVATDNENCSVDKMVIGAANAIEELLKAAKAMHTWIFLHSYDEQAAYDECHLSDEMNVALGYGGSFELRSKTDPCEGCVHYPPSSTDGKPCCACDPDNSLTNCKEEVTDD